MTIIAFETSVRTAAVTLLQGYASAASVKLQVYRARPRSIAPPTAFIDGLRERFVFTGPTLLQRSPSAELLIIHGLFDSGEAADQRDAFVDGFVDYMLTSYHAAGANTTLGLVEITDEPNYIPDWLPPEEQRSYYATRIILEGLALT